MSQFILIFGWIALMAFLAKFVNVKKKVLVDGVEETRCYWIFAVIAIIPVIFMAGYRPLEYGDTGSYMATFKSMPDTIENLSDYITHKGKDPGFYTFMNLIKIYITKDVNIFFTILAAIQAITLVSIYRFYSPDFVFSLFLFIASADYIMWMYNGIRQFTAVIIIFSFIPLLLKRKLIPLIIVILFASTIHQSALIMLPIVFIVQGEAWNKRTLFFIALVIIAIVFVGNFTSFLDSSLQDTQYKNVVSDYTSFGDDGTNPIRVLVYAVPTILSIYGRAKIKETNNRLLNICVNMSIVSTGIYIVSIFTSGMFLGRLPIYCSLFNYILLPWEIQLLFNENRRRFIYLATVVFYIAFYVYQVHFTWDLF